MAMLRLRALDAILSRRLCLAMRAASGDSKVSEKVALLARLAAVRRSSCSFRFFRVVSKSLPVDLKKVLYLDRKAACTAACLSLASSHALLCLLLRYSLATRRLHSR